MLNAIRHSDLLKDCLLIWLLTGPMMEELIEIARIPCSTISFSMDCELVIEEMNVDHSKSCL